MTYGFPKRLCFNIILISCTSLCGVWDASAAPASTGTTAHPLPSPGAEPTASLRKGADKVSQSSPQQGSSDAGASAAATPKEVKAPVLPTPPAIAVSQDPRPPLDAGTFINTMRAAWTYKRLAEAGGWPTLPQGTTLKIGDKGPLVTLLRQRLAAEGDLPSASTAASSFDAELEAAVRRFQARHGLPESGAVRSKTLEALNVPAEARHRQLTATAQRLARSTFPFGQRYVVANIPSATVEAIENGEVVRRFVAVVGKVDRPSPTVDARISAVNFNPTWTVPVSLIRKDIIPHMRQDPEYLSKMKIRILDAKGVEVDPRAIDWTTERAVNYTLRQDPGAINSLGQIRIDMPNKHAVYMHDTPKKRLFAQELRFHSSGCVRVGNVRDFVEWLLKSTPGPHGQWTQADIEASLATTARQDVRLDRPVPVAWVYLTGYATQDGTVHFRNDVYGLDQPKDEPLNEPVDVPVTSSVATKRS